MAVHGRFGQPCPVCGAPVQRIRYADNETNYCPRCQTGGKILADRSLSRLLKDDWPRHLDDSEWQASRSMGSGLTLLTRTTRVDRPVSPTCGPHLWPYDQHRLFPLPAAHAVSVTIWRTIGPDCPTVFPIQLELDSRADRAIFDRALSAAMSRHPLLAAKVVDTRGGPQWVAAEPLIPTLDWAEEPTPIDHTDGEGMDLRPLSCTSGCASSELPRDWFASFITPPATASLAFSSWRIFLSNTPWLLAIPWRYPRRQRLSGCSTAPSSTWARCRRGGGGRASQT